MATSHLMKDLDVLFLLDAVDDDILISGAVDAILISGAVRRPSH